MIFLLILALAGAMITVDAACVEREYVESNATRTTMDKVKSFFEEVSCTLKPFAEVVKTKVSSGYNYLKEKIDDANSGNRTEKNDMSNKNIIIFANCKNIDPDHIIFRDSDPFSDNGYVDATANRNPSTNKASNPKQNHGTTTNRNHHQTTLDVDDTMSTVDVTTSTFGATSTFGVTSTVDATSTVDTTFESVTTEGHSNELPMSTEVSLEDRIALTVPEICGKDQVKVDGKCRTQVQI